MEEESRENSQLVPDTSIEISDESIRAKWTKRWFRAKCKQLPVEPVLFLAGMSFFSFIPLNQEYIYLRTMQRASQIPGLKGAPGNNTSEIQTKVSSEAALFSAKLALLRTIPPIFTSILILSATDSFGRKFGMCCPIIGAIIRTVTYLIVVINVLDLRWLYISEFIDGCFGEHLVMLSSSLAFLSDTIVLDSLVQRFVTSSGIFLGSSGFANLVTGQIIAGAGFSVALGFVLICLIVSLLYIIFLLPESLPKENKIKFSCSSFVKCYSGAFRYLTRPRPHKNDRYQIWILMVAQIFQTSALLGAFDHQTVYMLGIPFSLSADVIGIVLGLCGTVWTMVPTFFVALLKRCATDEICLVTITSIAVVSYILQGLSQKDWQLFLAYALNSFGFGGFQIVKALLAKFAGSTERGAVQACIASVSSTGEMISKTFLLALYAYTVDIYHGISHFVVAFALAICVGLFLAVNFLKKASRSSVFPEKIVTHIEMESFDIHSEPGPSNQHYQSFNYMHSTY